MKLVDADALAHFANRGYLMNNIVMLGIAYIVVQKWTEVQNEHSL